MMGKAFNIILILSMVFIISLTVLAAPEEVSDNQLAGSFKVKLPNSLNVKSEDYVPVNEVANVLGVNLDWRLQGSEVIGDFGSYHFNSNKFVIANGNLYIPSSIFLDNLNIYIEIRGNNYFVYNHHHSYNNLELVINTDNKKYNRKDNMAVSILLLNRSNRDITLKYSSGQKYDLVLTRYNREVWRLSDNKGYISSISNVTITADDYILNTLLITPGQETNLYYGTYQLYAEIDTGFGQIVRSNEIELQIR